MPDIGSIITSRLVFVAHCGLFLRQEKTKQKKKGKENKKDKNNKDDNPERDDLSEPKAQKKKLAAANAAMCLPILRANLLIVCATLHMNGTSPKLTRRSRKFPLPANSATTCDGLKV